MQRQTDVYRNTKDKDRHNDRHRGCYKTQKDRQRQSQTCGYRGTGKTETVTLTDTEANTETDGETERDACRHRC